MTPGGLVVKENPDVSSKDSEGKDHHSREKLYPEGADDDTVKTDAFKVPSRHYYKCFLLSTLTSLILIFVVFRLEARLSQTNETIASLKQQLQALTSDYREMSMKLVGMQLRLGLYDITNGNGEVSKLSSLNESQVTPSRPFSILQRLGIRDNSKIKNSSRSEVPYIPSVRRIERNMTWRLPIPKLNVGGNSSETKDSSASDVSSVRWVDVNVTVNLPYLPPEMDIGVHDGEAEGSSPTESPNDELRPYGRMDDRELDDDVDGSGMGSSSSQSQTDNEVLQEHPNRVKRSNRRGKQSGVKSGKRHHKKTNKRGPVAAHFKGGLPETLIRDGGLVAPWYPDDNATSDFGLSTYQFREGMGAVEVTEAGLYLIYAQAYYLTSESLNSFSINIMPESQPDTPIAFCSTSLSLPKPGSVTEASCFTSIVRFLNATTRVTLKQRERNRRMILLEGHTFLGLVKLNSQQPAKSPRRKN